MAHFFYKKLAYFLPVNTASENSGERIEANLFVFDWESSKFRLY